MCRCVFVVLGPAGGNSRPQRQQGLCSFDSLNLTFLIDAQYQRTVGRVEVQADDIYAFLDESPVPAEFERF